MPLDNNLNVSELLKRLGVAGDSLASAPLLEALRMGVTIADLSPLVPPVPVPCGGASIRSTGGAGNRNKWSLTSESAGGIVVETVKLQGGDSVRIFSAAVLPAGFGAVVLSGAINFCSGQPVQSLFRSHTPAPGTDAPAQSPEVQQNLLPPFGTKFTNWIAPGEFFCVEGQGLNLAEEVTVTWREYTAGVNP